MRANGCTISAIGIFNIFQGGLTACFGALCLMFVVAMGGGRWDWHTLIVACLPVAGLCHAVGGGSILVGTRSALKLGTRLLGFGFCFALAFMLGLALSACVEGENVVCLMFLPCPLTLVAGAELVYLGLSLRKR